MFAFLILFVVELRVKFLGDVDETLKVAFKSVGCTEVCSNMTIQIKVALLMGPIGERRCFG